MDFQQRFYSGETFRPKPVIEIEKTTNTLIVATPWGSPDAAQEVIEVVKGQLSSSSEGTAVTRVTKVIEGLSDEGNQLRSAALYANEHLYMKENAQEYTSAVELAMISIQNRTISWVQIGSPHVLLKNHLGYQPICYTPDWSWQLQQKSPLVSQALGLERSCNLNCGSHHIEKTDQIYLISRATLPSQIYAQENAGFDVISRVMIDSGPETPFWLGLLGF